MSRLTDRVLRVVSGLRARVRRVRAAWSLSAAPSSLEQAELQPSRRLVDADLPAGVSRQAIYEMLASLSIDDAPASELAGYLGEDFERFVLTWSLATKSHGRALEIGANPYFTTLLLFEFSDLDVELTNWFAPDDPDEVRSQGVSYRNVLGENVDRDVAYRPVNVEHDELPYPDESFDVVFFCEVIEHLQTDPIAAIEQIHRVLRPGGRLILTTPNVARLENVARLIAGANIYDPYSGYGAYGRHNREYTRHELHRLLHYCGFRSIESFTADVHEHRADSFVDATVLHRLVRTRQPDLGQYLFVTAERGDLERADHRPSFPLPFVAARSDRAVRVVVSLADVLNRLTRGLRSLRSLPAQPQFDHLETRIDNLETALHREAGERRALRELIDERAFAMAQLASANQAEASRQHAEAAADAVMVAARTHTEEAIDAYAASTADQFARFRSELRRASSGAAPRPTDFERPESPGQGTLDDSGIDELLYLAIEDRFRGDPAVIRDRQEQYVPVVRASATADRPVLDLGCGRGEWLGLLAEHDVPARGIDSNANCVAECRSRGLSADVGSLLDVLRESADHSFGAITMFHVVEHLPFGTLADVFVESARVLAPGGVLVAETPNALNLRVAATNFWLDPTHVRPLHPELLRLLGERAGFSRFEDRFLNDIGVPLRARPGNDAVDVWLTELNRALDGPGDYALLAWTPAQASD